MARSPFPFSLFTLHSSLAKRFTIHFAHRAIGPCPIQLVVVMAVRKAVRAATITFTATSTIRFVFITFTVHYSLFTIHCLVLSQVATTGVAATALVLATANGSAILAVVTRVVGVVTSVVGVVVSRTTTATVFLSIGF